MDEDIAKDIAKAMNKYNEIPPFVEFGYEPKTTFWGDFGVADVFAPIETNSIRDTFDRAFKQYKDDREYGTELALVLNHKSWEHYNKENLKLTKLYTELFDKLDKYILDNWKGDDLSYYLRVTD